MHSSSLMVRVQNSTLPKQLRVIYRILSDCEWHSVDSISKRTGIDNQIVGARIRDMRKPKYQRRHPELKGLVIDCRTPGEYRIDPESLWYEIPDKPHDVVPEVPKPAPPQAVQKPPAPPVKEKVMAATPKKMSKLTQANFYHLCQRIERDKAEVPKFHASELAARYSKEMDIPISVHSVIAACGAIGVQTRGQAGRSKEGSSSRLEAVVRALCERLGEDFDTLANGHV